MMILRLVWRVFSLISDQSYGCLLTVNTHVMASLESVSHTDSKKTMFHVCVFRYDCVMTLRRKSGIFDARV